MTKRLTSAAVAIGVCILMALAAVASPSGPLARITKSEAESVAATAAGVYLSLRGINAVLSTAQEIELGGSLVVSGSAQPLKVLEPVDDTVERIASVVFAVMLVAGVLAVSAGPISAVGFGMMAVAAAVAALRRIGGPRVGLAPVVRQLGWYGGFLAVGLPLAFVASTALGGWMAEPTRVHHSQIIERITVDVPAADEVVEERSTFDEMTRYTEITAGIWENSDELIHSYMALLAVFLLQILVMPLAMIGAGIVLVRAGARDG